MAKKKVTKKSKKSNPVGAPTKYGPHVIEELNKYYRIELFREEKDTSGKVILVPNYWPSLEGFCGRVLGISKSTFHVWEKKYPELSNAYAVCKMFAIDHINQHALTGNFKENYAKMLVTNISDYELAPEVTSESNIVVNVKAHGEVESEGNS